jgi:hypothetical protein
VEQPPQQTNADQGSPDPARNLREQRKKNSCRDSSTIPFRLTRTSSIERPGHCGEGARRGKKRRRWQDVGTLIVRRRETGSANIVSIAQLLGGEQMPRPRFQNPTICKTPGGNATWYIRPWVDIIKDGKPDRSRKTITLGAVDTMGKREAIAKKNAIMATINRSDYVLQSQTNFGDFLDQ